MKCFHFKCYCLLLLNFLISFPPIPTYMLALLGTVNSNKQWIKESAVPWNSWNVFSLIATCPSLWWAGKAGAMTWVLHAPCKWRKHNTFPCTRFQHTFCSFFPLNWVEIGLSWDQRRWNFVSRNICGTKGNVVPLQYGWMPFTCMGKSRCILWHTFDGDECLVIPVSWGFLPCPNCFADLVCVLGSV